MPRTTQANRNGRTRRTRLAPDDRREHLIQTAVTIFAQEGVAASSVLAITRAAGVSNGTFYHYFTNKQELEDAVASLVIDELQRDLRRVQEPASYAERLVLGAIGVMRAIAANHELGAVMLEYLEHNGAAIPQQAVMLDSDIREGGDTGEFPISRPRPLLVEMFVAMLGVGARAVLDGADPDETGEFIAAAQLRAVGVPRGRAAAVAARVCRAPPVGEDA